MLTVNYSDMEEGLIHKTQADLIHIDSRRLHLQIHINEDLSMERKMMRRKKKIESLEIIMMMKMKMRIGLVLLLNL